MLDQRMTRKASIKETGEELSQAEWERFDAAVAAEKAERHEDEPSASDKEAASDGRDPGSAPGDDTPPSAASRSSR